MITFSPYLKEDETNVLCLNQEMEKAAQPHKLPDSFTPEWLPFKTPHLPHQTYFLAKDGTTLVGGYTLKIQDFQIGLLPKKTGFYCNPITRGLLDKRYNLLGVQLLQDALKKQPLTYCLGMGGLHFTLPQILKRLRWELAVVPFYFYVCNPQAFLKNLAPFRSNAARRLLSAALRLTLVPSIAMRLYFTIKGHLGRIKIQSSDISEITEFGSWTDEIWNQAKDKYRFAAVRNAAVLNTLYPSSAKHFIRLKIKKNDSPIGWAVVIAAPLKNHRHFGNLYLGTIVDCMAIPGNENRVISAAISALKRRGVDLIISNQSHRSWCQAMRINGLVQGPSNFIFATSPQLSKEIPMSDFSQFHLTRGDGDGPIHLF